MSHLFHISVVAFCFLSLTACANVEEPDVVEAPARTVELRGEERQKADVREWSLALDDLRLTVEPRLDATYIDGRIFFRLRASVSHDLVSAQARQRHGFVRSTELLSPRRFEVALGRSGMEHVLSGQPLFIELETLDGRQVTARVTVSARFYAPSDARLYLDEEIVPVRFGDELRLRGRYQLPEGHELLQVFTDDDAEIVADVDGNAGLVDFTTHALMLAADIPEDPVYFDAWDTAETHYRSKVGVGVELDGLALSGKSIEEAWPQAVCDGDVQECLMSRERGDLDTERCGLAPAVDACAGLVVAPAAADAARFEADLRRHVWLLYANEDPVVLEPGAADLTTALSRIEEANVRYVGPEVESMERFDPAHVDVWRHRDPISSGRAGHWYGAYDYGGNLLKIWRR